MQIRIYFVAALLALVTALSPNLSPTAAQGDIPTIMFPAKLNKDQVSFGLVRMMQKAGCYFDVYREDIRVFLRTRASPICVIDPKVRLPILSRKRSQ